MSNFSACVLAGIFFSLVQILMVTWGHVFEPMYTVMFLCTAMVCDSIEKGRK
ncbi:hypothetical protein VPHK389_0069 [Vibrio phage K389]|nr:hypothetical protein SIPHO010v1_p0032 [Vibrio phage 268E42.1]